MTVVPAVAAYLAQLKQAQQPDMAQVTVAEAREQMVQGTAALGSSESVPSVEDRQIDGPAGKLPLRIYRPRPGVLPGIVFFHGGGWVVGSVDSHDGMARAIANACGAVVVSVDYRLAPEHTYPAAAEDAYAATVWVAKQAESLQIAPTRLAVAGDSAGGNLAAVVALMARDRGGPPLAQQTLIYPVCDANFETKSYRDCAEGYMLTRSSMQWFWQHYCPAASEQRQAYASPLRAESLRGLPPALVITAEYDPLCDEGEAYARRLQESGVSTRLLRYPGQIHGFMRRIHLFSEARAAITEMAQAIAQM